LGIAPAAQLASGLTNPGVITVAAMLVIAKGIVRTGLVSRAAWSAGTRASVRLLPGRSLSVRPCRSDPVRSVAMTDMYPAQR
jgi:hypothetical protein